jgi:hypothetical protein
MERQEPQGEFMGKPFYLHKRGGVFYACLVNQETGERMSARSTGERDKEAAITEVYGWLREGVPGRGGERRKAEAALGLDTILRNIRKAKLDAEGLCRLCRPLKSGA